MGYLALGDSPEAPAVAWVRVDGDPAEGADFVGDGTVMGARSGRWGGGGVFVWRRRLWGF